MAAQMPSNQWPPPSRWAIETCDLPLLVLTSGWAGRISARVDGGIGEGGTFHASRASVSCDGPAKKWVRIHVSRQPDVDDFEQRVALFAHRHGLPRARWKRTTWVGVVDKTPVRWMVVQAADVCLLLTVTFDLVVEVQGRRVAIDVIASLRTATDDEVVALANVAEANDEDE